MEPLFQHTFGLTSLRFVDYFPPAHTTVQDLVPDLETVELEGHGGVRSAGQLIDRDGF